MEVGDDTQVHTTVTWVEKKKKKELKTNEVPSIYLPHETSSAN